MMADVAVSVTVMGTTNQLPINSNASDHLKPDRICRLVIVPTITKRHVNDVSGVPIDSEGINQLTYLSMVVRIHTIAHSITRQGV